MGLVHQFEAMSNQRHASAVRRGLMLNMPIVIIGSLAVMLSVVPYPWYRQMMFTWFGPEWEMFCNIIVSASLNILSILLVISISYFLGEKHPLIKCGLITSLIIPIASLTCFMTLVEPFAKEGVSGIPFQWAGLSGVFLAIVAALAATEIFLWLCSIKAFRIRLSGDTSDPLMSQTIACVLPLALTVTVFALVKIGATALGIIDIHNFIYKQLEGLFTVILNPLSRAVAFILMVHLLWFFGMHGNNIFEPLVQQLHLPGIAAAASVGGQEPVTESITKTFLDVFVLMGGSGSTICLILAICFVSRRGNMAGLTRLSLIPGAFNINELLIFGLPIVFNPVFLIPFLLIPVLLTWVSYEAISIGFVAPVAHHVHWTTPPFISGYLATESWSGVALQLFNTVIGTATYLPFVIQNEREKNNEIKEAFRLFLEETRMVNSGVATRFLTRHDTVGALARVMAHDLKNALYKDELFLEYQPQVHLSNRVIGVEALLRWSHRHYGRIPPPLIVAVAEETGLIHDIGRWIIAKSCDELSNWRKAGIEGICMSVNLSVMQLQNERLAEEILDVIKVSGLEPQNLKIEITENIVLNNDVKTNYTLEKLRDIGVNIAIDDFGMGHTSLRYIKQFPVHTLKIDSILSRDVVEDKNCQEIIASIVALCASLNIEIVVEHVETEEQRDRLNQLGCTQYQGYFYSPPLPPVQVLDYILRINRLKSS